MVCFGCEYFSKDNEDYFVCSYDDWVRFAFDLKSLEAKCPIKELSKGGSV